MLTIAQLQQIGYDFGFIHERGTDVIDRVVFYDPAGNPISDLKWSNDLDLTTIALPIYMEHLNATGIWNGSDYVGLEDELDWEDLYNDLYGDVDPSDMDPEGGYGTTDYTGFDYSGVQNAPEYQNPEYDVDTAGAGFKEYLDKEFGGGAGSIQAALLAAGTPEEQLEIFGYDPTAGQITTSGLDALFLGIAQENIKKAMFKGILDKSLTDPLSEEDIRFFSDLGAPEYESRLNLIKQQREAQEGSLLDTLTRTEEEIARAEDITSQEFRDLPERLREPLLDADAGIAQAGASELGYGRAVESRASLSEESQEDYEMSSEQLQRRLEELNIAGTRAEEDYQSGLDDMQMSYEGTLLDIKGGISSEVGQAQGSVTDYITSVLGNLGVFAGSGEGTAREGGQKKTLSTWRAWT